jgi:periplasmic protein TonB
MASRRLDRRQGFLISATIHLMILTLLVYGTEKATRPTPVPSPSPQVAEAVQKRDTFMVPPRLARRLARPEVIPVVPAQPEPPPRSGKDRISIGPPSTERARQLELKRDQDLTNLPSGPGGPPKAGPPSPPPPAAAPEAPPVPAVAAREGTPGTFGPGLTTPPRGTQPMNPGSEASISRSLRELDRRLGQMGSAPSTGGAGQQMGPLFFDPEGADFTGWINHFKNEVYRNWIVPEAVRFGFRRGHVDFEFWVERDGRLGDLRLLKSSGTAALDRAAHNALLGSRLLALPSDFGPARVRMQVTFYYNEGPQG